MKIHQNKDNQDIFLVESESHKGKFYEVDAASKKCNCIHFIMRLKNSGQKCKHIIAVEEFIEKNGNKELNKNRKTNKKIKNNQSFDDKSIIEYIRKNKQVDSVEFIKKFSEEKLNEFKRKGIIIEEREIVKLLE